MKIKVKLAVLQELMRKISVITPSISHRPELTGIAIDVFDSNISFQVRSDILDAKYELDNLADIKIEKIGSFLIKGRIFNEVIQKMKGDFVELIKVEENLLVLKSDDSEYEINLMKSEKFERLNLSIDSNNKLSILGSEFKKIVNRIQLFINPYIARRVLQGANIIIENNLIKIVGTDGVRVVQTEREIKYDGKLNFLFPIKSLREIIKIIDDKNELEIWISESKLLMKFDNFVLQTSLIEGVYPDVISIIPKSFSQKIEIKKHELSELIDRSTLLSVNRNNDAAFVKIIISNEKLKFESREMEIGYANIETTNFVWKGDDNFQIAFNPRYILEALKSIHTEDIILNFNDSQTAFLLQGKNKNDFLALIMPFRL